MKSEVSAISPDSPMQGIENTAARPWLSKTRSFVLMSKPGHRDVHVVRRAPGLNNVYSTVTVLVTATLSEANAAQRGLPSASASFIFIYQIIANNGRKSCVPLCGLEWGSAPPQLLQLAGSECFAIHGLLFTLEAERLLLIACAPLVQYSIAAAAGGTVSSIVVQGCQPG